MILIVVVYMAFRFIPVLYASNSDTMTLDYGTIEKLVKTKGIIVRDEKVYKSQIAGGIERYVDEGQRVGAGIKISSIVQSLQDDGLEKRIESIDNKIEKLKEGNISKKLFKRDISKNTNDISGIVEEIRESTINEEYDKLSELKSILAVKSDKQMKLTGEKGIVKETINRLSKEKENLLKKLNDTQDIYYSQIPGVISYKIDGLENIYTPQGILDITPDKFNYIEGDAIDNSTIETVKYGHPIYKIINNYEWYLMVKIDNKYEKDIETKKSFLISFGTEKKPIKGKVVKVNNEKNHMVVIFKFNEEFSDYYDKRYMDVTIILNRSQGLKVPNSAIDHRNGSKGVYTKNVSNLIKFRPIEIVAEDDKYAIVKEGYIIKEKTEGEVDKIQTLLLYDQIIIDSDEVREMDVVN